MEAIKKYAEREIGVITDSEYLEALPYARRKLQDISERFNTPTDDRYLAMLVAETVRSNRLSAFCYRNHARLQRERKPTLPGNSTDSHDSIIAYNQAFVKGTAQI